jgi:hypothetical protein
VPQRVQGALLVARAQEDAAPVALDLALDRALDELLLDALDELALELVAHAAALDADLAVADQDRGPGHAPGEVDPSLEGSR